MTYRDAGEARRAIERNSRFDATDEEWAEILDSTGVSRDLAIDGESFDGLGAAFQAMDRFRRTWHSEVRQARALIGLQDGLELLVTTLFGFRSLEALETGVNPNVEIGISSGESASAIGQMMLAAIAAQRIADKRALSTMDVFCSMLNGPNGKQFDELSCEYLKEWMQDPRRFGFDLAFGEDLRNASSTSDLRLVESVVRIVKRERRAVTALTYRPRWAARYEVYSEHYQASVGRDFSHAQNPSSAFASAFKDARKRVVALAGVWPQLDAIT